MLNDPRLTTKARNVLKSQEHELFFSLASLWELSIKIRKGKLRTLTSSVAFIHDSLAENKVMVLPVRYEDILSLEHLDDHHRDPFDRIIVAQAIANGLKLLTEDADMKLYPVQTVW
jgi:PIN domain nuclease of toxin-antitoxin system